MLTEAEQTMYRRFGHDFSIYSTPKYRAILQHHRLSIPQNASHVQLLAAVERSYAEDLVRNVSWTTAYLAPDFDPHSLSVPQLRQILSFHGVRYDTASRTKGDLKTIFACNIVDMREWFPQWYMEGVRQDGPAKCTHMRSPAFPRATDTNPRAPLKRGDLG